MQFVLELQWILRLAFSPMQLDFESAPFSHLGTSPWTELLYQWKLEKSRDLRGISFGQFQYGIHASDYFIILGLDMGPEAWRTVFYAIFCVAAVSAAVSAKRIQWTVAEKTIKFCFRNSLMTGKIFTVPVLKKAVMVHGSLRKIVCNPLVLCYNGRQRWLPLICWLMPTAVR